MAKRYWDHYLQHLQLFPNRHYSYEGFKNLWYKSEKTRDEIIRTPKSYGNIKELLKQHIEIFGKDAITYCAMRGRIKNGRDHGDAVCTPRGKWGPKTAQK